MIFDTYVYSTAGGRSKNEDSAAARKLPDGILCVLADGLGGHGGGEIASDTVIKHFMEIPINEFENADEWFQTQFAHINQQIIEQQEAMSCNMRSTAAVILCKGNTVYRANIGDSRIYTITGREIEVTEDHSVAYKKYKSGEITRAEIGSDEDQPRLLRALGNETRFSHDYSSAEIKSGDGFLLCSDGLWEYVYDNEVLFDYLKATSAREWAELMLTRAISRIKPGNDNLSMITILLK